MATLWMISIRNINWPGRKLGRRLLMKSTIWRVAMLSSGERILVLGAPTLFFGPGPNGALLLWIVFVLAFATVITVVQRIVHVARETSPRGPGTPRTARTRDTVPGHAPALQSRKGH